MPPREPQELPRPQAEPQGPQGQQRRPSINGLVNTAVLCFVRHIPTKKICSKNVYVDWSVKQKHHFWKLIVGAVERAKYGQVGCP